MLKFDTIIQLVSNFFEVSMHFVVTRTNMHNAMPFINVWWNTNGGFCW